MNRNDHGLVKAITAAGAIAKRRIVTFSGTEGKVQQAASAAAIPVGVTGIVGAVAADEVLDILMDGNREIEAGAAFSQGDPICADAQGRAILCAPGSGVVAHAIGFALAPSGAAGQIVPISINRFVIKG